MAQEMVGTRLPLMCAEVSGELREPNPQKGIVSSKTGFLNEGRTNPRIPVEGHGSVVMQSEVGGDASREPHPHSLYQAGGVLGSPIEAVLL